MASRRTVQKLTNSLHAGKSTTTRKSKKGIWEGFWNELLQAALQDSGYSGVAALPVLNQPEEIFADGAFDHGGLDRQQHGLFPADPCGRDGQ